MSWGASGKLLLLMVSSFSANKPAARHFLVLAGLVSTVPRITQRRNALKPLIPKCFVASSVAVIFKNISRNWSSNRMIYEWNILNSQVISADCKSFRKFKRCLDKFMDEGDSWTQIVMLHAGFVTCKPHGLLQLPLVS